MKATGIVRRIDELGRIVLPVELRRSMGLEVRDSIEIYVEGDSIILKKYSQSCVFCGGSKNITVFRDKTVCGKCLSELCAKNAE